MDNRQKTDLATIAVWAIIAATLVVPFAIYRAVTADAASAPPIPLVVSGLILGCFAIYKIVRIFNGSRSNPPSDAP